MRKFPSGRASYYGVVKDSLVENRLNFTSWGKESKSFDFNYKKIDSTGLDFNFIFEGDILFCAVTLLPKKLALSRE